MAWNPAVPATNADLVSLPIRENFQALDAALYTALTGLADGTLLYRGPGPALAGENNLLYDAVNNNLKLFGGGVGTSGQSVLALGPGIAPTTSPVDTVQLWAGDFVGAAGSRGLEIRDERGGRFSLASYTDGKVFVRAAHSAGPIADIQVSDSFVQYGTPLNYRVNFIQNNTTRMALSTAGNAEFFGGVAGASGTGVLALGPGTAPTTSPVDTVQLVTLDHYGAAASRGLIIRDEQGSAMYIGTLASAGNRFDIEMHNPGIVGKIHLSVSNSAGTIGTLTNMPLYLESAGGTRLYLGVDNWSSISVAGVAPRALNTGAPDSGGPGLRTLLIGN